MSARKPLDERCDGGVLCPVEGHVTSRTASGAVRFSHIHLTRGQNETLWERRTAARAARPARPVGVSLPEETGEKR